MLLTSSGDGGASGNLAASVDGGPLKCAERVNAVVQGAALDSLRAWLVVYALGGQHLQAGVVQLLCVLRARVEVVLEGNQQLVRPAARQLCAACFVPECSDRIQCRHRPAALTPLELLTEEHFGWEE